jgi:hypothetical protein
MTLFDWLTAGDIADREIEEYEAWEWFRDALANPGSGSVLSGRTASGRPGPRRARRWSRARVRKVVERWLALLGPFAALLAAILGLLK